MTEPTQALRPAVKLTREQVLEFIDNPLKQLPEEWRIPVWDFWAYFEHLLPTQIALCTRIRRWRDRESLEFDELQAAMDDLRSIDSATSCRFAAEVLDGLKARIDANRKAARDRERAERDRRQLDSQPTGVLSNLAYAFHDPNASPVLYQKGKQSCTTPPT